MVGRLGRFCRRGGDGTAVWHDVAACCLLLAAVAFFYLPFLIGRSTFCFEDFLLWFLPARLQVADAVTNLSIPQWDPWVGLGQPLVVNPAAAPLYPLNLLSIWGGAAVGLHRFIALHIVLGGMFSYGLARSCRARPLSALVGAFAFAFCGVVTSYAQDNPYQVFTLSWIPLAVLLHNKALDTGRAVWALATGGPIALMLMCGEPLMVYFAGLVLLACSIAWLPSEGHPGRRGRWLRIAWTLGVVFLVGFLLSIAQWAAILATLGESERGAGFSLADRQLFSLAPLRLFTFVLPYFTGVMIPDNSLWANGLDTGYRYTVNAVYVGLVPLLLLPFAWRSERHRRIAIALCIAVGLALLAALGQHTPVHGWLDRVVPGLSLFRYPEKWVAATVVPLCLLAALGFESWRTCSRPRRWTLVYVAAFIPVALIAVAMAPGLRETMWRWSLSPTGSLIERAVARVQQDGVHVGLVSAAVLGLLLLYRHHSTGWGRYLPICLCAVSLVDVVVVASQAVLPAPIEMATRRDLAEVLRSRGPHSRFRRIPAVAIEDAPMTASDYLRGKARAVHTGSVYSFAGWSRNVNVVGPAFLAGIQDIQRTVLSGERSLDAGALAGVRFYLFADEPPPEWIRDLIQAGRLFVLQESTTPPLLVVEDRAALERARRGGAPVLAGETGRSRAMEEVLRSGFDIHSQVLIDTSEALFQGRRIRQEPPDLPPSQMVPVTWLVDRSEEIVVRTEDGTPGWLTLADAFAPGWRAWVDGQEVAIFRANGSMRAVAVPAGPATVRFAYEHPWLAPALHCNLVVAALWLLALIVLAFRSRGATGTRFEYTSLQASARGRRNERSPRNRLEHHRQGFLP